MRDVLDELVQSGEAKVSGCSHVCGELLRILGPLSVIEIGTSYGRQLSSYSGCLSLTCIDPMYGWVPDVSAEEGYDSRRTDQNKLDEWNRNMSAASLEGRCTLITDNSFQAYLDDRNFHLLENRQVLVIDGCHHPDSLVEKDYDNYGDFLTDPHYVIWDDIGMDDVGRASRNVSDRLKARGFLVRETEVHGCRIFFVCRPTGENGSTPRS